MAGRIRESVRPSKNAVEGGQNLERLARQLTAETGRKVTAEELGGRSAPKTAEAEALASEVKEAQALVAEALKQQQSGAPAGRRADNPGWDGANGFEATKRLESVTGGDVSPGDATVVPKPDAQTKASLDAQLAMALRNVRKV